MKITANDNVVTEINTDVLKIEANGDVAISEIVVDKLIIKGSNVTVSIESSEIGNIQFEGSSITFKADSVNFQGTTEVTDALAVFGAFGCDFDCFVIADGFNGEISLAESGFLRPVDFTKVPMYVSGLSFHPVLAKDQAFPPHVLINSETGLPYGFRWADDILTHHG